MSECCHCKKIGHLARACREGQVSASTRMKHLRDSGRAVSHPSSICAITLSVFILSPIKAKPPNILHPSLRPNSQIYYIPHAVILLCLNSNIQLFTYYAQLRNTPLINWVLLIPPFKSINNGTDLGLTPHTK